MNKLSKILIVIIIILMIALGLMAYLYFDMRGIAKEHLEAYVRIAKEIYKLNDRELNDMEIIEYVKSIEDSEERRAIINIFIENGELTQDVADGLY